MKPTFFDTPAAFRSWFEANHTTAKELLVGFYKRGSGKPSISWPESVDEALCFGWIDGVRKSIDEDAYTIRFTPRKPTSIWSAINVAKVAALEKLGRMTPAGRRAFEKRTPERTGVYSFERTSAAALSADEERALRANAKAAAFFDSQAPWYRRTATHWVVSPKREETRRRRFEHLLSESARGRTIGPLTRPAPDDRENGAAASAQASRAPRRTKASRSSSTPRVTSAGKKPVATRKAAKKTAKEPGVTRRVASTRAAGERAPAATPRLARKGATRRAKKKR